MGPHDFAVWAPSTKCHGPDFCLQSAHIFPAGYTYPDAGALALSTFWHREQFHSDVQVNHFLFTNSLPLCHVYIPYSILLSSPFATSSRVYLNGTWRCHRNLPCGLSLQVYTQYPRPEVFLTSSFSCMRLSTLHYPWV